MTIANALLRAKSVGVRNFRNKVSKFIKRHEFLIVTERGNPTSVLVPYNDVLEIVDILEELEDKKVLKTIAEGRRTVHRGQKGISVSEAFKRD